MKPAARPGLVFKTLLFSAIVVVSNVAGNYLLSSGMKASGVLSPLVWCGVALLIVWTLARMALLSWADLSFVLPVTAIGYPLNAVAGALLLNERITTTRWAGTVLIIGGTVLVGLTARRQGSAR